MVLLLTNNSNANFNCFPTVFNRKAVQKRSDDDKAAAPPLLQENVFIESSRPKYLEDLHTEAQEGLKMMQQEEINNGVEFQDNESTISSMTMQTDGESGGFTTDSTIQDTSSVVSVQSSVSTRSSRSGLTRQGSTFRPLNSGKKADKVKRGRHRKTVGGIPQHVRREMGLDRAGWTLTHKFDEEQLYNGETDTSSTSDGPQLTASSPETSPSLPDIQPFKNQMEQLGASHAGHRDDLALLRCLDPHAPDEQRPHSLAVPWMTTANGLQQEQPGPVMSMSPQAAYMSKIIPNAVLPPSIEVVEISRGRSRSSLRTVSKSSLLLSSPTPSRASSRASSSRTTSSRTSNITSASRYNPPHLSDSSCWTTSESSDTLVSDSSTIASSTAPRQKRSQDGDASAREDRASASKCTSNGKVRGKVDEAQRDSQFVRSLSVMKPKRAPPPPSRSYSLHSKMKRRSRDLHDVRVISAESSPKKISREENKNESQSSAEVQIDSPSYHADTSSLDDSTGSGSFSPFKSQLQVLKEEKAATKDASQGKQENKLSKVISPSSGYSSQDAVSPHSSSPRPKKGLLAKLQRLFPSPSSAGSAPASDKAKAGDSVDPVHVSPSVRALRDLFNIPPPPKVHAPPPPPPEVWAHSKRSVELLLGPPVPDNLYAIVKKNPKDRRQQRQAASAEGPLKSLVTERKQQTPAITVASATGSLCVLETKTAQESRTMKAEMSKENDERLAQNVDLKGNGKVTERDKVSDKLSGMLMKAVEKRDEWLIAKKTSAQATDAAPAISSVHISPSSTAARHKQPAEGKVAAGQAAVSPETSWPPPPSPSLSRPDEPDFPFPPPPLFGAVASVMPVQVPPEKSGSSQAAARPTLAIPPPPPYSAPPPPLQEASPSRTKKVFLPLKEAFPPPPEFAPPKFMPPPPKEFAPTSLAPPPPASMVVSPPAPPLPAAEVLLPAPEKVSPPAPPPPVSTLVSPPAPPPPVSTLVSPPAPPPPVSTLVSPPAPPPVSTLVSPPAPPPPPVMVSLPVPKEFISPPTEVVTVTSLLVQEVKEISYTPDKVAPVEEVVPLPPKETASKSCVDATLVRALSPPSSIPPPPPLPSQPKLPVMDIDVAQEKTQSKAETSPVSCNGISPPQTIPPPIELLHQPQTAPLNSDNPVTQEAPPSDVSVQPAPEISPEKAPEPAAPPPAPPLNTPLPPPLPEQSPAKITHQPSSVNTENQNQEVTSVTITAQEEEPGPIITPSLLQAVKLRSVNSSPEPPKAPDQPQSEVTRKEVPSIEVPTSSANGETPQKPIRKSLIVTSSTSAAPPVVVTSQTALPKSQSLAVPPASASTAPSPTKKSPSATGFPSMNLQEAIRLRAAGRSRESAASRLSAHSPTSPLDPLKSPSSTANFIFSKNYKKVVIETKPPSQAKAAMEVPSVPKAASEAESLKAGVKMPPPVAKKPKTKGKENEAGEETERTAGQEGEQEDNKERQNGTAGTVEEAEAAST
ncbi:uncharacterized protein KIAA1522 homolog isoform X2 [Betta splendens]|uniref:Uncharacterized protein KIAA1522 homolog isoform X2 n=1 Tax=Betta splendens TaxID=158456 RepID=A0A6P7LGP2_BETSP|nr:uncharacterized protein KIAA1522 homolog isoform X2 [Betta splendens]